VSARNRLASRRCEGNSGGISVAGGPPQPVTRFTSDKIFWFDWSRDGRLALSRGTEPTDAVC